MTDSQDQAISAKEERFIRIMRSVVINMGILLVVGTIALFIMIAVKANSKPDKKVKTIAQQEIHYSNGCTEYKQADISLMGEVISSSSENNILTITTNKEVIAYDLCAGKIMAKFQSVGEN